MFPTYPMGRIATQTLAVTPAAVTLPADMNVQSMTIRAPNDFLFHFEVGDVGFPVAGGSPVTLPFDPARQTIYLSGVAGDLAIIAFAGTPQPR